jgi:hypothetical protein
MKVEDAWRSQRQWSGVASSAARALSRWRLVNLSLLLLGAVLSGLAAQKAWFSSGVTTTLGAVAAAALALSGVFQVRFLNGARMRERLMARSVSEGLKGVVFQYLARVGPFAGEDREARLSDACRRPTRTRGRGEGR